MKGATKAEEKKMDIFHRKQLRRILGIRYPTKITNGRLYQKTGERPISETMRRSRWKLLGHILRREDKIPANMAMALYYNQQIRGTQGFRAARRTTLPTTLNEDLQRTQTQHLRDHTYCKQLRLNTADDLEKLKVVAKDRKRWRWLVGRVTGAGRAELSVDNSAEDH